ncbi:MAG: hypothetical protein V7739_17855 [Motiliproteus sp.]
MSETSLYERLGGEQNIRTIAGQIFDNHKNNKTVSSRYQDSDREQVVERVTEFLCAGTGGPQGTRGRICLRPIGE